MELTKCAICGVDLEDMRYGSPEWDYNRAPSDKRICYECLDMISKYVTEKQKKKAKKKKKGRELI